MSKEDGETLISGVTQAECQWLLVRGGALSIEFVCLRSMFPIKTDGSRFKSSCGYA